MHFIDILELTHNTLTMESKELVIAVYDKDLSWTSEISEDVKVTVYRKGDFKRGDGEIMITPNRGRCVHTFFYHLYMNYDSLADYTFFAQDYPFDHWGNIIEIINGNMGNLNENCSLFINSGYWGFHNNELGTAWSLPNQGWLKSKQVGVGTALVCDTNGHPQENSKDINLHKSWKTFFVSSPPVEYEFMPGGHFAIAKEHVHLRAKEFYKKVLNFLEESSEAPWVIERFECYIFNPTYKSRI